jgi:pimeloyl-ACP methyl ester carboxylesterase
MKRNAFLVVLCFFVLSPGTGHAADPGLTLGACTDARLPKDARCGTYEVFENRAAKTGRKVPLRVVVLPALGPDRLPDPVVYFTGGPGNSNVRSAAGVGYELAPLRQRRDFLFVDLRGTGGSAPLECPELHGAESAQEFFDSYRPADKVRACRDRLSKIADLAQYTTDNAVDDVDEVRAALGYPQMNLIGASYGTRVVLVYLRRHPDKVRTAILEGVALTSDRGPLLFARFAQTALDGLAAECASDTACAKAFPRLQDDIAAVFAQAERQPARVDLLDPKTVKSYEVRLSRGAVAQTLRYMLYDPISASGLPLQVHLAAQGNWKPLAETASSFARNLGVATDGFYLAITCSEDVPFIRDEEIPAAVAGTFLGDLRIRAQRAACAEWPAAKVPESYLAPVTSDVPVLIVDHERDPVTPPSRGAEAARTLRHSKSIVIPDAGHVAEGIKGLECLTSLWVKTIEDGSVDRLDTSCIAKMERPAFVLSEGDPEVAVGRADLEALVGSYDGEENGTMKIDLVEGRLRMGIWSNAFLLVPTAPTRFRPNGLPGGYALRFERDGKGPATAVILVQPGFPDERMVRKP